MNAPLRLRLSVALSRWLRRKEPKVLVRLTYQDGGYRFLGPMDHFTAEVLIVTRLAPNPHWEGRRVFSAVIW